MRLLACVAVEILICVQKTIEGSMAYMGQTPGHGASIVVDEYLRFFEMGNQKEVTAFLMKCIDGKCTNVEIKSVRLLQQLQ